MRILEHGGNREIGNGVAGGQRRECDHHESELGDRGRVGDAHQRGVVAPRADQRRAGLHEPDREREHQGEVADLRKHEHWLLHSRTSM